MQIYPTRSTFHVAVSGVALVTLGAAARVPPIVAFGGAMLLAVALGRAAAHVGIARLRGAGLEMVWAEPVRLRRMGRGATLVLHGELRNRSDQPARACGVRVVASSLLELRVSPPIVELPAQSRSLISIEVTAKRVGRWGIHGLALEVRGTPLNAEGLYEVPLLFANPLGIEVLPAPLAAVVLSARGGRARRTSDAGLSGRVAGVGDELRELRDHVPGDPFKRIAWKASARRGRLLVRDMDREERDIVWLVVDASVELWAGAPGSAPLDRVVDHVADVAARHLAHGDPVGLVLTASRVRVTLVPARGPGQASALASALADAASFADADRTELDEADVARLVMEHARPLDPRGLTDILKQDLDALAARATQLLEVAPFSCPPPFASTPREQALRRYLAAFGVEFPPRIEGEREKTEAELTKVLERLATERSRFSVAHVWAPPPARTSAMARAVALLRRRVLDLRWTLPPFDAALGVERERRGALADVVDRAVRLRARATRDSGERTLRRLGVRVLVPHERT